MHKAFPLPGESSHWQYKFPLPVEGVPAARRMEIPLQGVCTAMMKKLPVKDRWQKMEEVSDAKVADRIAIGEIHPRVATMGEQIIMENLPPLNGNQNAPEEEPFMDQALAAFDGFVPHWFGEHFPNINNWWIEWDVLLGGENCPKCGNPVDGHYCQGCALLRKKFKEDMFTSFIENGILLDAFEPSNDNTNVVNALRYPFVVNQDLGIFCHQCTCELYGNDAHYGYNCLLKVPIIPDLESFNNQTIEELPPTVPSFDLTCHYEDGNSFTYDSTSNLVYDSPNIFDPPLQLPLYSCEFCENDARSGHYYTPQVLFIYPEPCYNQDFNFPQDFHDF
nr:hypothetical protein [Tanacetum cinerariifolium]